MALTKVPALRQPAPLRITYWLAILWIVIAAGYTIYTVLTDLLSPAVPAAINVGTFWPTVNPTLKLDGVTGSVVGGGFDHASLLVSGLGLDARLWLASATFIEGLASCALGVTLALLCNRVAKGDPFDRVVPRAFTVSGVIVLVGGLLWQIFNEIAGYRVISETFDATGAEWKNNVKGMTINSVTWPKGADGFSVSFWPITAGLALFAIAVVFRYGAKISRERAALAKEVEGLV